ncbi:N-formylglutamate deformylase [Kineobactrum salinum]|uniref:N-formylglutamate deformylase n=1 Tax=Kineobactrum salinum TaxID=2708301 RepID=A0A6C0UAX3_9GAMM|nr:N-formylglutamate deformylase [Kineobactrum salinum]QIB67084.1 N-formylglutamate deformylase [Kineobactrum salinum]
MSPYAVHRGNGPVVLGIPHAGTWLPEPVLAQLNTHGRALADTDWHVDRLYDGLLPDATVVRANFHRYLIDANRDPSGSSLYPGQSTTALVPTTDFDGAAIWSQAPSEEDIAARLEAWHRPYHAALAAELERVRALHGVALLYECHSIRSRAPLLFEGQLPDLNVGSNSGRSCAPALELQLVETLQEQRRYSVAVNARFKGGWATRHYGQPRRGVHAIQLEITQRCYLRTEAPPWHYDEQLAEPLRELLARALAGLAALAPQLAANPE